VTTSWPTSPPTLSLAEAALPEPAREAGPPLRVLHLYKSWAPAGYGGVEQMITTLGVGAGAHGIVSRVAYLGPGRGIARVRYRGIGAYRFPLNLHVASTGLSLSWAAAYPRLTEWADVLHFHFPWPYGDLVHLGSGVRKPMLVTYHLDITRQRILRWLYWPLMQRFLRRADLIVATSENVRRTSSVLQRLAHRTEVIPLGVDDRCAGQVVPIRLAQWRHRLGEGFALFVGVLRYYKGLPYLLEAARSIRGRIVIAGTGPCELALKRQARRLRLSNVVFVGEVTEADKEALYRLCHVFVFPSHLRSEGFGLALVEAAMHGKPMVSCEIGTGTSFVNRHGETGLVVPPRDPAALSDAVNRLLADRWERDAFGRNARQRYVDRFTADAMSAAYAAVYRRLAEGAQ
jgi:glycosyltransferase involved in cell wall biosynthesis